MVFTRIVILNGARRKVKPFPTTQRLHATSTMDLVSADEMIQRQRSIASTVQFQSTERDYSASSRRRIMEAAQENWNISWNVPADDFLNKDYAKVTTAHELDLIEAAERLHLYDKVLFLLNLGEHLQFENDSNSCRTESECLTGRGVGHALSLSRRTATFCTEENGLQPGLFILEPSKKAAQTAFLSFPYLTPFTCLRETHWVCHPDASANKWLSSSLSLQSLGIDCSLLLNCENLDAHSSMYSLAEKSRNLLKWIFQRDEKVVVVVADALLLQVLGSGLQYRGSKFQFQSAEMRAVGVCFG